MRTTLAIDSHIDIGFRSGVLSLITVVFKASRRWLTAVIQCIGILGFFSFACLPLSSRAAGPQDRQKPPGPELENPTTSRTTIIRVLDETGQPLSKVNVYVTGIDLERNRNLARKSYPTDLQGEAAITFPEGKVSLQIWPSKTGYVPQVVGFRESEQEKDPTKNVIPEQYVFHFQRGTRLSGSVVDVLGKPIAGAKVQVKLNGKAELSDKSKNEKPRPGVNGWLAFGDNAVVTDDQGRWEIDNAPALTKDSDDGFQLMVAHPEFTDDRQWGESQQKQGITTEQLRNGTAKLSLERGIAIAGTITGPDGEPVTNGLVIWDDRPYWATGVNETRIDESGRFQTLKLAPGDYPVTVLAPGYAPEQRTVSVSQSLQDVNFRLGPGNSLKLEIVDPSGEPIPGARVGIGQWKGTEAIYNVKHSNVPESGVPRQADQQGIYAWDWAPSDGVQYRINAKGFDTRTVTVVPRQKAHRIVLFGPITFSGRVVDSKSGEPIKNFRVVPVKAFRPDFYSTDFQKGSVAHGKDGEYRIEINSYGSTSDRYRVRVEAEGYRTALGPNSIAAGEPPLEEDFRLEATPALVGSVVDRDRLAVEKFTVAIGTPTSVPQFDIERPDTAFGQALRVEGTDRFELPATFEPQRIRVFNESGFAEILRQPNEPLGTIILQPWASVTGRLLQDGQPIPNEWIYFRPLARYELTEARFQDSFAVKTDRSGHFRFDKLPPVSGTLKASLGPWRASALTSSQSLPLNLKPGDGQEVLLGGDGETITGLVVATGRSNEELSKQWSLNYLVSRERGISSISDVKPHRYDGSALDASWLRQPEFESWLPTREHHFVKLGQDGSLRIHGVPPGAYDLVIQLYEQPAGCLVETVGEKVIPVTIAKQSPTTDGLDLGKIEVACRIGPRTGSDMRAFQFTDSRGRVRFVDEMSGRYVLFHVWASWCQPCLASMPDVKATIEEYADDPLTAVGLNIDSDPATAKLLAEDLQWNWSHNCLGDDSDMMRQLAVSTVPAYYLIGPDGKLVGSANSWEPIKDLLSAELR